MICFQHKWRFSKSTARSSIVIARLLHRVVRLSMLAGTALQQLTYSVQTYSCFPTCCHSKSGVLNLAFARAQGTPFFRRISPRMASHILRWLLVMSRGIKVYGAPKGPNTDNLRPRPTSNDHLCSSLPLADLVLTKIAEWNNCSAGIIYLIRHSSKCSGTTHASSA